MVCWVLSTSNGSSEYGLEPEPDSNPQSLKKLDSIPKNIARFEVGSIGFWTHDHP